MPFDTYQTIFIYVAGVILLIVAGRLFLTPIRLTLKLLFNGALGVVCLLFVNLLGSGFGFSVALNAATVVVSAVLGLPGVALLLFLRWLGL
jgi:inhibitor of the pro-sigma K processing machinery